MSTDYGEKERQFLGSLQADTGRDLAAWMVAIDTEGLKARNDIIDWLRRQGFMFSKASWLERIHNNGGKPIYGEGSSPRPRPAPRPRREPRPPVQPAAPAQSAVIVPFARPVPASPAPPNPPQSSDARANLDGLLGKAKAFRPLAAYVLDEIKRVVPDAVFTPEVSHVAISRASDFAALAVSPRELRLGLALGTRSTDARLQAAKFPTPVRVAPAITHMVVLDDARQVEETLLALIRDAARDAG